MPSLKCSSCGHRILLPTEITMCTNCGSPLSAQPLYKLPSHGEPLMEFEQPTEQNQAIIPYTPHRPPARVSYDESMAKFPSIQRYQERGVEYYQPPITNVPPSYFDVTPEILIDNSGRPMSANGQVSSLWQRAELPWWLPARPPDIEGTIIQVQSQMEHPLYIDFLSILFKQLRNILWSDIHAHDGQDTGHDTVFVTVLRIRAFNGSLRDARMEGYLTGAHLSLGDTVFLWGRLRKGALFVRRGYNYSSKGMVSTRSMAAPLLGLFLLLVAILAFFIVFSGHPIPGLPTLPKFP